MDGGLLVDELFQIDRTKYTNITYITANEGYIYSGKPIKTLLDVLEVDLNIFSAEFDDPLMTLDQNCTNPIGELHKYYVELKYLKDFARLNFDHGKELFEVGYNFTKYKKYKLC